jgi:hypothetical protein
MRYLVGFVCVLALLASPLGVSAQTEKEVGSRLERWHPEAFVDPTKPAPEPSLQLELDSAGVDVTPSPPRTPDGYTLEEMDVRVRRAGIGVGVSVTAMVVGLAVSGGAAASSVCISFDPTMPCPPPPTAAIGIGMAMMVGGLGGTIASGILLRRRKRERDRLKEAHYGTPRRVQWDLTQSRLVF